MKGSYDGALDQLRCASQTVRVAHAARQYDDRIGVVQRRRSGRDWRILSFQRTDGPPARAGVESAHRKSKPSPSGRAQRTDRRCVVHRTTNVRKVKRKTNVNGCETSTMSRYTDDYTAKGFHARDHRSQSTQLLTSPRIRTGNLSVATGIGATGPLLERKPPPFWPRRLRRRPMKTAGLLRKQCVGSERCQSESGSRYCHSPALVGCRHGEHGPPVCGALSSEGCPPLPLRRARRHHGGRFGVAGAAHALDP